MNIEQVRIEKTKEAQELFLKLGINQEDDSLDFQVKEYFNYPIIQKTDKEGKKDKIMWTRLSINSNLGCIVE